MPQAPAPPIEPPESHARFPDPLELGSDELVGVTRTLTPGMVLQAYRQGIFPWPVRQGVVPWASPDPRAHFPLWPDRPWPRTVRRALARGFSVTVDQSFEQVLRRCGETRAEGTWITPDIVSTYCELHRLGWAHSIEVRRDERLLGGLYGLAVGGLFAGESMFHLETDASKVAFAATAQLLRAGGFQMFDVQVLSGHLSSLGCVTAPRRQFLADLPAVLAVKARWPASAPKDEAPGPGS